MLSTFKGLTAKAVAAIDEEKKLRQTTELVLLFPLGSQFDHLIKQAIEKLGVFCLVADPARVTAADIRQLNPVGIILSGGPVSVHTNPPPFDHAIFDLGVPILGICLGFQLWAQHRGVQVATAQHREFGPREAVVLDPNHPLFVGCPRTMLVLQSHGDVIYPDDVLTILAATDNAPISAAQCNHLYGVQFHPEVRETASGSQIFENFIFGICGAKDRFPAEAVAQRKIAELRQTIGDERVLLALSGGSDSSTVAYLLGEAVQHRPGHIIGVYIKGLDRPDDERHVRKIFGNLPWLDLIVVDATDEFVAALKGHETMRSKRVAMRGVYKAVLEREIERSGAAFIAQGTLYTDISESGSGYDTPGVEKAQIKLHHNTGLGFSVPELTPLDDQVKDTGRNIGRSIGVPEALLTRHPFPGPGLSLRIEGEVTTEKLAMARLIDGIFIAELRRWNLYDVVWQALAFISRSVATVTKGDDRGEGTIVILKAVDSMNGFTATWSKLPFGFLDDVSRRITDEVPGVGLVTYAISNKPPATIECG